MGLLHQAGIRSVTIQVDAPTGRDKAGDDPSGCPNGARHTSPGCNPGYGCVERLRSVGTPHRARVGGQSGDMRRSFRTHLIHQRSYPGLHPGLVCVAPLGQFRMRVTPPSRDKAGDDSLGLLHQAGIRSVTIQVDAPTGRDKAGDDPSGCPNGARHTSPGCNPGYGCVERLRSVGTPHRARVGGQSGDMRRSFRTHLIHQRSYPGLHPGLVCVAPLGQFRMRVTPPSRDKAGDDSLGLLHQAGIRSVTIHWGCSTKPG